MTFVRAGLVPAIHGFAWQPECKDLDGQDKSVHDESRRTHIATGLRPVIRSKIRPST
jgi:hypothetical protein